MVEESFVRSRGLGTHCRPATLPEVEGVWFSTVDPRGIPTLVEEALRGAAKVLPLCW